MGFFLTVQSDKKATTMKLSTDDEWSTYWWAKKELSKKAKKRMKPSRRAYLKFVVRKYELLMKKGQTPLSDKSMRQGSTI